MRRLTLLMIKILMVINIYSQDKINSDLFKSPVDFKIYLSSNFAELRADHFHSGIDIKTQGVTGKPVYSIADGYVSRIKVQTNGYGKSVYINHPGGYTSLYGHLDRYNDRIAEYVKKYQYKNKIHTLDIYPAVNEIPVKQGQFIARAGNSGSSLGPHLHFEIRKAANQHPLNVQKFGFDITDNVDPRIYNFYLYTFEGKNDRRTVKSRKKLGLKLDGKSYSLKQGDTLSCDGPFSFGMEVFDFLNGVNNRCGIYFIKTFVDGELVYHFQTDEFSFAESRYINAHTDYALLVSSGEKVHCLFHRPNNKLSMYPVIRDEGIIELLPGEVKSVRILFSDISGNERSVQFSVVGDEEMKEPGGITDRNENLFTWNRENQYTNEDFKITIPAGSLYEDTEFSYNKVPAPGKLYPWKHNVNTEKVPLHLPAKLSFKADEIPAGLMNFACIVSYDEEGEAEYQGGEVSTGNWITTSSRSFGTYSIEVDTLAPQIIPGNFRRNSDLSTKSEIRLIIKDDLSGITSYKGFIDNTWVLFEYDPKNDLLFHTFDPEIIEKGKSHELEIYVADDRGNQNVFHSGFYW